MIIRRRSSSSNEPFLALILWSNRVRTLEVVLTLNQTRMTASQLQSSIPWSAFSSWKIPCHWRTLPAAVSVYTALISLMGQLWAGMYCSKNKKWQTSGCVGLHVTITFNMHTDTSTQYDSFSTIQCLELAAATYVFFFKNQHPTNQNLMTFHADDAASVSPSQGARFLFQIHAADETPRRRLTQ